MNNLQILKNRGSIIDDEEFILCKNYVKNFLKTNMLKIICCQYRT